MAKKELIRETAISVMAELGYHESTTDRIAQEGGMAVGTIYNYFRNKEEILQYIFQVEFAKRKKAYEEELASEKPALEKLGSLLEKHFRAIEENILVGKILVREHPKPGGSEINEITKFLEGVPTLIQTLLNKAMENGEIRSCDTELMSAAFFGAVQGMALKAVFTDDENKQKQILQNAPKELMLLFKQGLGR
ncbi:MAG: TetR/AcrR family transcriptional regulator [Bacillota bacterium]|mgnify:FL=1|nr:TetR/AcrR family transcriptional regulator [Bacillota bacterium]HHU61558.1 TetR/AcrR family transcriptional regulator [Natronincola sp.]